jgi:hypothetical protein
MAAVRGPAATAQAAGCQKVDLTGEVNAGQEWKAAFGQGWVFRVIPIAPGEAGYSGWDLVVDREQPAGFPDALLVATPPYRSINEHEVGTTFGLRAQDAIGWNPRSFRFLTAADALRESQKLYQLLSQGGQLKPGVPHPTQQTAQQAAESQSGAEVRATRRLMDLLRQSSPGQFRILDARLAPGISDAAPYAENWALASPRTPHTLEPGSGGKSTPLGQLHWMRFSVTLWLPAGWKAPAELHGARTACPE